MPELASQPFYDAAWLALSEPGALVVNWSQGGGAKDTWVVDLDDEAAHDATGRNT